MDTYQKAQRLVSTLIDNINHDCTEYELRQRANWAFGAGLLAGALIDPDASMILFKLDKELGRIAYEFTNSSNAIAAAQELKSRLVKANG